jgi:hypothetical protein
MESRCRPAWPTDAVATPDGSRFEARRRGREQENQKRPWAAGPVTM